MAIDIDTLPGHEVLALAGKKVLRPGGLTATRRLFKWAKFEQGRTLLELASSFGLNLKTLAVNYGLKVTGIDNSKASVARATQKLQGQPHITIVHGDILELNALKDQYDYILAEAIVTMQAGPRKAKILANAYRRLKPGGKLLMHELVFTKDTEQMHRELSKVILVNANALTEQGWRAELEQAGFVVEQCEIGPMSLLTPAGLLRDEGLTGIAKIVGSVIINAKIRKRVLAMRAFFSSHQDKLAHITLCARKPDTPEEG